MEDEYSFSSVTIVTPHNVERNGEIKISGGKIIDFSKSKVKDYPLGPSFIVFPAIFNAHDHLFGTYYPKIGKGPYICWLPWDYDLKNSEIYLERNKNSPFDLYLIGAYKNLISGVTTVHDHIPHKVNEPYIDKLPIRVLREYALSHEASSYDLKWGDGIDVEYQKAVQKDIPYVTHIEEGFDEESLRGVDILLEHKALSDHTVVIHGIGFSEKDIKLIAKKKVNFIWCPGSNMYMFGRTAKIKEILDAGINTCLGTDSPATGEIHILEEIRFAKKTYHDIYNEEISDETMVKMVTCNPAKAFRMLDKIGTIEVNKFADLLLITGDTNKPYSSLVNAQLKDIALVIMAGKPLYGSVEFKDLFRDFGSNSHYSKITIEGKEKYVVGDPKSLLEKLRKNVGFRKELPFLPIQ
jgi:cytosine/adenosine deaminase-related metal-dependent hydrolase